MKPTDKELVAELLAALESIIDILPEDSNDYPDFEFYEMVRVRVETARAVIAKAKNEE